MPNQIHQTAIIEKGAEIGENVKIGPYSIIGPKATIHDNVEIKSHVVISNRTTIGEKTKIFPFASIGEQTQDLKYKNADTELIIGKNNVIREYATMNPGTAEGTKTIIGDNSLFMIATHVAHDCVVGNNIVMSNNATLAGHVTIEDNVIIGGLSAVKQFIRVGRNAMIGGATHVIEDVIPYGIIYREKLGLKGLNLVGLKRHNFSREEISALRKTYEILFENSDMKFSESLEKVKQELSKYETVSNIIKFIESAEGNPICQPISK